MCRVHQDPLAYCSPERWQSLGANSPRRNVTKLGSPRRAGGAAGLSGLCSARRSVLTGSLVPEHKDFLGTKPHVSSTSFGWMRKLRPRKPGAWFKVTVSVRGKACTQTQDPPQLKKSRPSATFPLTAFPSMSMGSQCFGQSCHPPQLPTSVLGCRCSGRSRLYRATLVNQPAEGEPWPESMHETKV